MPCRATGRISLLAAIIGCLALRADEPSVLDKLEAKKIPAKMRPPESAPAETFLELGSRDGRWDTLAIRPDGRVLATSEPAGALVLWSLADLRPGAKLVHREIVVLAWSPDGKTLAASDAKGNIRLWSVGTGTPSARAILSNVHKDGPIWSLAWSPDGKWLASAGQDKVIKLWDASQSRPALKATLTGHEKVIRQLAFSPDGQRLASAGSSDKVVRLWDMSAMPPKPAGELPCEGPASSLSWTPDSKALAVASYDSKVRIWKLDGEKPEPELSIDMGQKAVRWVLFAPDGKSFAVHLPADLGDRVAVRDREGGKLFDWSFRHHIQGLTYAPDGRHLLTANEDSIYVLRLK